MTAPAMEPEMTSAGTGMASTTTNPATPVSETMSFSSRGRRGDLHKCVNEGGLKVGKAGEVDKDGDYPRGGTRHVFSSQRRNVGS
jgi:hypothetical protein